jgi:hypothetical protein
VRELREWEHVHKREFRLVKDDSLDWTIMPILPNVAFPFAHEASIPQALGGDKLDSGIKRSGGVGDRVELGGKLRAPHAIEVLVNNDVTTADLSGEGTYSLTAVRSPVSANSEGNQLSG